MIAGLLRRLIRWVLSIDETERLWAEYLARIEESEEDLEEGGGGT